MRHERGSTAVRRGRVMAWVLAAIAGAATAALVVVFLRNLPAPPRYDELTIEPGSTTPIMRGIVRRVYGDDGVEPLVAAVNDVAIDAWPEAANGRPASIVVHRIPIERAETTFAVIGVGGVDVTVVVRRGRSVVLRAGDDVPFGERFDIESDSIILPDGVSDLEVEMRPRSEAASAGLWWREVEGPRRPVGELLEETNEAE